MKKLNGIVAVLSLATLLALTSSTRCFAESVADTKAVVKKAAVKKPLKVKIDLSSPERTVRTFVAALNVWDVDAMSACIDGGIPYTAKTSIRGIWDGEIPHISLMQFAVIPGRSSAVAKTKTVFRHGSHQETDTGNVPLVRRGDIWLLVAMSTTEVQKAFKNKLGTRPGMLAGMVISLRSPEDFIKARQAARRISCSSNLAQIALGALSLNQDKGRLAMTPANFKEQLLPYLKDKALFRCPSITSGESYSFNVNLIDYNLENLSDESAIQLVLFYEGKNGKLDFRHDGRAHVAFVYGHVKAVSREQAAKLRWNP